MGTPHFRLFDAWNMNMSIENRRFALQQELDIKKTNKDRNHLGQFSTPFTLAMDIARYALSLCDINDIRFLEPAIGTGVFFSALRILSKPLLAVGYEIDPHYALPSIELWRDEALTVNNDDFLCQKPNRRFNLILANPPYSRHHHIDSAVKQRLQYLVESNYGLKISGLSGLYCYFLVLSTLWLQNDGISCWLIPSEFMDVKYGEAVKRFLTSNVDLISIHRFDSSDLQFSDALVSSSIVTFKNRQPSNQKVRFSHGGTLFNPHNITELDKTELNPSEKWSLKFDSSNEELQGHSLGHYFKVSRGISTGNNSFFILSTTEVLEKGLPMEFLTPILPAPRHLSQSIIFEDFSNLDTNDKYFLLSCPLPIEDVQHLYPQLYKYIIEGESKGANNSYNCQKRVPWYTTESRQAAPIYMTYMGRGENASRMFRFILNESESIVTNSYLMLYPREKYKHCISDKATLIQVWKTLNSIPKDRLSKCGRSYGGGLFKIEPKELELLKIPELKDVLKPIQTSLFDV